MPIDLPPELKNLNYPNASGETNVAMNRAGFALSDLKIAGLLESPRRSEYRITKLGKQALADYGSSLTRMVVHDFPKYKEHQQALERRKAKKPKSIISENSIQDWFEQQREATQDDLLKQLVEMNPYKFESLMIDLLSVMGYKGDDGQALVTQKSNDGGIDGGINQDPLGLQKVFVQVKRYASDNVVGRPEIAGFSGSIKLRHADRGVFITTSSFTKGAIQAARDLNITLVNGDMLTNLMIQYHVGVQVEKQYEVYKLDQDAFTD